jgi:hypothetical protein
MSRWVHKGRLLSLLNCLSSCEFAGKAPAGQPELVDEEEGTLVENASRLEWDRRRVRRPSELADPAKADAAFVACLLGLLRKVQRLPCD